ncbi:unnamed protein product [Ilex paraguariensis]|uniref:Olee1-like protein n=1 Tax=Ilex paraguariensis TaxID=185542 RepID=A0ABC8S3A5_9AQUA
MAVPESLGPPWTINSGSAAELRPRFEGLELGSERCTLFSTGQRKAFTSAYLPICHTHKDKVKTMAKAVALVASALCFLALASLAQCHEKNQFHIEGKVYCDTCRVQFETRISDNIPGNSHDNNSGAKVRLECKNREHGKITYSVEGVTDANGQYSLLVEGDHEEEICEVRVVESPREDCADPMEGLEHARVACTGNNGLLTPVRYANPLGFMKKESLSNCKEVLDELGFLPITY